jgi:hypothetical protein
MCIHFDLCVQHAKKNLGCLWLYCGVSLPDAHSLPQVYSGGLDNTVSVWELRKGTVGLKLSGHSNTITGLKVSPDGHHLLTNSMDNTLRIWDLRPFAPANRCVWDCLVVGRGCCARQGGGRVCSRGGGGTYRLSLRYLQPSSRVL